MSGAQQHHSVIDDAWDSVVGGFHWLKSVLLGEFEDNRPLSAIIADMLVSFIPAVVIATSARDAIAVILRMAKHPEKREEVLEWVLLCACLITIALPLAMAAAGVAAAGVGAVVGGIAGSELGAALRAVMLLLVKASTKLVEVIHFLQKFIKGDILKFLKAIKFAKYEQALLSAVRQFTGKLIEITQGLVKHLDSLSYFQYTKTLIAKLKTWERSFYAVQTAAIRKIPLAMAELDARLAKVLAETLPRETHVVPAGVKAPKPKPAAPPPQHVRDVPGRLLRDVEESAPKGGASAKPAAGKATPPSHPSTPPPKLPDEKPTLKDKADDVPPPDTHANTEKQNVIDPKVAADREEITRLSRAGDIDGARSVLQKYVDEGKNAKTPAEKEIARKKLVDCLDVSSPKDKAFFWSGWPTGFKEAESMAAARGGVVLETTTGGRVINSRGADDVWAAEMNETFKGELWEDVSRNYAKGATGEVNSIQLDKKIGDPSTVWSSVELPELKAGQALGNVSNINIWKLEGGSIGSTPFKTISP